MNLRRSVACLDPPIEFDGLFYTKPQTRHFKNGTFEHLFIIYSFILYAFLVLLLCIQWRESVDGYIMFCHVFD
jgi:hypothetical protein